MTNMMCRLCLNEGKLINTFDSRLTNSAQLRKCILLGTGVEIRPDDLVTKYVCQHCSDVAILLYKYRKKALANDKALKELAKQNISEHYTDKDMVELNRTTLEELSKEDESIFVNNKNKILVPRRVDTLDLAVHPTIIQLIKTHPKLKIPNHILKCNVQPSVLLDRSEAEDWTLPPTHKEIECTPKTSAIERFKRLCPQISIVKVSEETITTETHSLINVERRTSESPCSITSDVSKRKRSDSTTSEGSTKSAKKHRMEAAIISSMNNDRKIPKLVISLNKTTPETPSMQETSNKTPSSTPTLISTDVIDINNESDVEQITPKKLSNREPILKSDIEDSDYQPDPDEGSDLSDDLLDTIDEEIVINCGICNKMFNTRQQLRSHERVHRQCTICNGIFRTSEILRYHQQEICFKRIIVNSPKLELIRVDEIPEVVKAFPNAFNPEQKDTFEIQPHTPEAAVISDDDDDVILIEDDKTTTITPQNAIKNSFEYRHICQIFKKYRDLDMHAAKHKNTETKPRICIKYNVKNQIVLENMYSELQNFRVPVELIAKPTSFAYISFNKKQAKSKDIYCWANERVVGLSENKRLLTALLGGNSTVNNIQKELATPTAQLHANVSQPIQTTTLNVINTLTQMRQQISSKSSKLVTKQPVSDNVVIDLDEEDTDPVPSTSRLNKDIAFSLRVKTPSELNTL